MPLEKVGYTKEGIPSAYFNDNKAMSPFFKAMKDITQCFYMGMHDNSFKNRLTSYHP